MKNYHSILEVPKDASKEQIRARYKQLVRIFHPDRYSDPKDKQFVEERMREINEAYNALVNPTRAPLRDGNEALPQPVVLPPNGLDFGKLPWGSDQTLTFHVGNVGGDVRRFKLAYSEENSWFRVTEGARVHATKPFPLRFGVAVDTHALEPGKNYHGWIDINMDEVTTRINLHVHVVTMRAFVWLTPRLATVLGLLILGLILALPQMLDFNTPIFSQNGPAASSSVDWQQEQAADENAQRAVAVGPRLSSGSENVAAGLAADTNQSNAETRDSAGRDSESNVPTATASATPTASPTATAFINTPTVAESTPTRNLLKPSATVAILQSQPTAIPIEPPRVARNVAPASADTATATAAATDTATATTAPTNTPTTAPTETPMDTPTPIPPTSTETATNTATATHTTTSTASPTDTVTNTPRPTATPTPAPTFTSTGTFTGTSTPTQTATQTNTATPDFSPFGIFVQIPADQQVFVRSDIFVESNAVALLQSDLRVAAIGRTFDNAWTRVRLADGAEGWIFTETVLIEPTQLETLPIVAPDSSN
ncbi:MAG: DnaJ domain-containing protein [Caldilineaceae bacterium]